MLRHVAAAMRSPRIQLQAPRGVVGAGAQPCRDPDVIAGYLRDASGEQGAAEALYRPESEAEIAAILADASRARAGLTVVAGQTSTTGSSVPRGDWVLSTERLVALREHAGARALAEPGIRLGELQRALEAEGWLYPPDPTSRHDCTLGGSVACNASGARSFRYGATRRWVRGLRAVLPSGGVLALQRGQAVSGDEGVWELVERDGRVVRVPVPVLPRPEAMKHAAGYASGPGLDLVDLFVGSEGTLGVVSEVEIELLPLPERVFAVFAFFGSEAAALTFVERARTQARACEWRAGELAPRCLEWLDAAALGLIREELAHFEMPAEAVTAVFAEQEYEQEPQEESLLEAWLTLLRECGALVEHPKGVLVAVTSEAQERFREVRHAVPVAVNERLARRRMPKLGTDLSVPDVHLRRLMAWYRQAGEDPQSLLSPETLEQLTSEVGGAELPSRLETITFGHAGDSHLHLNLMPDSSQALALARAVYAELTHRALALGGSPSAEHGIGKLKTNALWSLVGDAGVEAMRATRYALDPDACLGRDNLFAWQESR